MPPGASPSQVCNAGGRPVGACAFAEALAGTGTPASWLQASILIREVNEFAANWHGVSWGAHTLIDQPTDCDWRWLAYCVERAGDDPAEWPWEERTVSRGDDFGPRVVMLADGDVWVTFFSESNVGQCQLIWH